MLSRFSCVFASLSLALPAPLGFDRDHMQLDVVYCERNEQTCVAVAVPIMFPYHCQNGETCTGRRVGHW